MPRNVENDVARRQSGQRRMLENADAHRQKDQPLREQRLQPGARKVPEKSVREQPARLRQPRQLAQRVL